MPRAKKPPPMPTWYWMITEIGKIERPVLYYGKFKWFVGGSDERRRELASSFRRFAQQLDEWAEAMESYRESPDAAPAPALPDLAQ